MILCTKFKIIITTTIRQSRHERNKNLKNIKIACFLFSVSLSLTHYANCARMSEKNERKMTNV